MSKVTPEKFNQIIGAELPSAAETGIYLHCAPAVPLPGPS
jgi:hypothetical protein